MNKTCLPAGRQAFTIIEMLIYMGIISVFIIILFNVLFSVLDLQAISGSSASVDQAGQYVLTRLSYDIRRSVDITSPGTIGQTATALTLNIGGTSYLYNLLTPGVLTLTYSGKTYPLTPFDVVLSNLSFTRLGNTSGRNSLKFNFTLTSVTSTANQKVQTRDYQTTVDLR